METKQPKQVFKEYLSNISEMDSQEFELGTPFFAIKKMKKGAYFVQSDKICTHFGFLVED